jgi:HK97 family phage major capsid protein
LQGQDPASRFAPEMKAYQSGDTLSGGSFITPVEMANEIITLMKDLVFMRQLSRHFTVTQAGSLGFPTIDTDPSDTDWTAELAIGNEETTLTTGRRELKPSALAKSLKLSKKLLRMVPNFESVIMDRLAYKVGITQEKAFLAGDGSNKPLGVFTASPQGISTNRDNVAANAASIVADDLWNTYFKLKAQYRAKATWIINRTVLQAVRKLKDANNNYIWATGIGPGLGYQGLPATLLGLPYCESEYAPGTIATGLYTAILGDFSHYYIADALSMEIQVLYELYAANNQMGYILRLETDGMPVLEEAFARLKQA